MRPDDPPFIRHRRFEEALEALDDPTVSGLLVIGSAGVGKTSLLRMIEIVLSAQERPVFSVSLNFRRPDELGARVIDAIRSSTFRDAVARRRTIRGSAGVSLDEAAEVLHAAAAKLPPVVLLLGELDAAPYPGRTAAAVEDLARRLPDWKLVVASRPITDEYVGFDRFRRLELGELSNGEARRLVEIRNPELSADSVAAVVERAEGHPLVLTLLAGAVAGGLPLDRLGDEPGSTFARRLVEAAIESTPEAENVQLLLEQLARTGGRAQVESVAAKLRLPEDVVLRLADIAAAHGLVAWQDDESASIEHPLISEVVLARGALAGRFRLADLNFGAEEAEKDTLLDESYVRRPSLDRLLEQRHSIVIGDRGSGKSAIFRKLASPTPEAPCPAGVTVCPVANSSELLPGITGAGSEVDAIRAAWLVVTGGAGIGAEVAAEHGRRPARRLRSARSAGEPRTAHPPSRCSPARRHGAEVRGGTREPRGAASCGEGDARGVQRRHRKLPARRGRLLRQRGAACRRDVRPD